MASEKADSFQCGPFEVARNPDVRQFVEKLNRLRDALDSVRLQPGVGYSVNRSSGGTTLSIQSGGGGVSAKDMRPFQLSFRKKDQNHQFYALTGTMGSVTPSNVETWVTFRPPANIFLEAKISEMKISDVTLGSQPADQKLAAVEIVNGQQTFARISVGFYVPAVKTSANFRLIQNVFTNVLLPLTVFEGYPAFYPLQEGSPKI